MRTRSRSRSRNNSPQQEASPAIVEPLRIELPFLEDQFQEDTPPESPMADNQTMAELLQAPTEGYEDAIVIPEITANNFELKYGLINLFFPPSKTTNLRNKITRFQQRFDESFYEAWERFNDLLRACPRHGFSELHQLDTFYNALNINDQDLLNSVAGGNFLDKMPRECLKIIESKSKVRQSRAKAFVAKVGTSSSTPVISSDVAELKDMVKALLLDKKTSPQLQLRLPLMLRSKQSSQTVMDECLALADLGANINLMPLSVWEGLSPPELTPICMTLELMDRSVSKQISIAKDVSFKVRVFHFPADFVVVDFEPDPRVPLILRRCFLKTSRALIDVHKGELTLCIGNEAITYNLDQTVRYFANYNQMTANKIDVVKSACEEYSQEVLGFSNVTDSGTPTPQNDLIVFVTSPTLTSFRDSDFLLLEEADAFLGLEDDPDSSKINPFYYDPEGDILLLEDILNKVELKDLPHHLEYAFLEGDNKLPVIIAKELRKDYKPAVQHQRRVNPKIHDVIKKEVEKLLDAGLIYPISDSPWVSPIHCVPKKGGFTVVENEENELIRTRFVTRWRVCIDYRKLNEATRKDNFPLPFMDQMLERLAGNEYYCFLDGFFGYFQILIDPRDQEKTTFTRPYGTFAYRRMPFGLCNAPGTF
nr:reverse transcriptase domain-containing protein [Tanacetum cinerariifolium]